VNAWREALDFELPPVAGGWRAIVDTSRPSPGDIRTWDEAEPTQAPHYRVGPHALVFLAAGGPDIA
jgi:hypothetical protein